MKHLGTVILETEDLILRPFTIEDAPSVYQNWANDPVVTEYLTWQPHADVDASRGYLQYCIDGYKQPAFYQWGIVLKSTGELIGNISVVDIEEEAETVELGWVIGRAWWGQGIMPQAAKRVIAFLLHDVGAKKVAARHDVENTKSGRVMQKAGMTYQYTSEAVHKNNRGMVCCAYYAIEHID